MSANDKGVLLVFASDALAAEEWRMQQVGDPQAAAAMKMSHEAHAAAKELRDAAEAVCERGTDSPLWQRLEAALARFDGAQP